MIMTNTAPITVEAAVPAMREKLPLADSSAILPSSAIDQPANDREDWSWLRVTGRGEHGLW